MENDYDMDMMLCLTEVLVRHDTELLKARAEVHKLLLQKAWRIAVRSRHYLPGPAERVGVDVAVHIRERHKLPHRHEFDKASPWTLPKAEKALPQALEGFAPARISFPSPAQQVRLAKLVEAREPLLKHTFGFIDGKSLRVMQPSDADLQNAMCNGWLHSVFVTGTICFAADGCIIWCKYNCPGSWNDSNTSLRFRMKLRDPASVRQAAEWGMGSIQKVYSRLNLLLPYDPVMRGLRLKNIFRLVNYRTRTVEISRIRSTFSGEMELSV
uniref:DDE Tnp4 domain-containing protein n=1 Tax=Phytophthora ramorum TaxID=164328 RepID=H3GL62_PHYRM